MDQTAQRLRLLNHIIMTLKHAATSDCFRENLISISGSYAQPHRGSRGPCAKYLKIDRFLPVVPSFVQWGALQSNESE
jgi:hypothetical protein